MLRPIPTQVIFLAAAGVLAVGGIVASQLIMAPPKYAGPSTQQILATSQRLQTLTPTAPDADSLYARTRAAVAAAAANRRLANLSAPEPVRRPNAAEPRRVPRPAAPTRATRPSADSTPASSTPAASPGADLALTGIAGSGNSREVMLFHLADRKRESGKAGDTVFGFTIAAIHDDRVDMTQGSTELTLRLGEKSAAVEAALAAPAPNASGVTLASNSPTAAPTGATPFGAPGGRGDWRARMAAAQASFNPGNQNLNNRRGGGNNNRRRNSTTSSGARRYSNGPDASRRYSTVSSGSTNRNNRMGGFRGGFGGFGGRGRNNQGNPTYLEATSNPQEARRTGAPLIGGIDVEAMFVPEALANPQTERRIGSATGQAFGNNNFNNNRNGNNRGGFGNTGRNTGTRTRSTRG